MGRVQVFGNPPITVEVRKSARARRLSLRVSRLDGKVSLTTPPRASEREVQGFLESRADWVRGHLATVAPMDTPQVGGTLMFRGTPHSIVAAAQRGVQHDEIRKVLVVPEASTRVPALLKGFLRQQARDALAIASDGYADRLGRTYTKLTLRDTRSRWGSCTSSGGLMYSWRLIMAPPDVLNYVAAHEVAHLVEMNHSTAFWDIVADLMPDYENHRRWLRENGTHLHQTRFTD